MNNGLKPSNSSVPWAGILNLLAAVIYGASPIDLIPDFLVLIGWVDDAIAVPMFIIFSVLAFVRHRKNQKINRPKNQVVEVSAREPQIPTSPN